MKIPNYLMTSLAFVGAISLIIKACSTNSATDTAANTTTVTTPTIGKYQLSANDTKLHVLDTETGIIKTYAFKWINSNNDTYEYVYKTTTATK